MFAGYTELCCISNFTFLRGASHPEELVTQAHALGYSALAITDECSLAGVVRAHGAAKECGLKLLIGSEFRLACGLRLLLLAMDRDGYGNLSQLITRGRRRSKKGCYHLTREDVAEYAEGCLGIWLPEQEETDGIWMKAVFPHRAWIGVGLFLEGTDTIRLQQAQLLSKQTGLPVVACGDVHMHVRGRRPVQDVLTAIRLKTTVQQAGWALFANGERHLRSLPALQRIYPGALLEQTLRVAECCRFSLDELRYEYPRELVPMGKTPSAYLRELTEQGMQERWPGGVPQKVRDLVEHELALIAELRYEPYFLTVHDIVGFARSRNILCQGRGSAANSAVCFCLGITAVDPDRIDTLFERFISKERNEPPDIDVDFEHERREEVIQYLYHKYGRERAALTATVITYRPKSAIRDVGKALGFSLEQVDQLAKTMRWWDGKQVMPERLQEAGFDSGNPMLLRLTAVVNTLVGFPRHLSQHVGGFVIARDLLSRLVPIENACMEARTIIQWDKDDLDALGLLKVDCLGLGMLSAIRRALDLVNQVRGTAYTLASIPAEDPQVYVMIQQADTVGVFQIESRAQMAMLPRLRPACFYDLVVEVAIVRPGPIQGDMVHPYLRRRQGLEPVEYPSDGVRKVLQRTLGVPIFQEQVIQVAMVAAGFTPGEADQLRRSMAAWRRRGGLEHFEQRLIAGMEERGYEKEFAQRIFQQILGFGEYGFPESHAASFALLVYVSAWLKCHEPAAFTCALLNSQPMGFYAPAQLVQDAQRHGVEVRPVDVQVSGWDCGLEHRPSRGRMSPTLNRAMPSMASRESVAPNSTIPVSFVANDALVTSSPSSLQPALRLGLQMVKGLSQAGAERLVAARNEQAFVSVEDLAHRAGLQRKDMEALAAAGALKTLAGNRHQARWACAGVEAPLPVLQDTAINEAAPLLRRPTEGEDIVADYASVGVTLGRHPLSLLRRRLRALALLNAREVRGRRHGDQVRTAGLVICRQRPGAGGVTFVTLEDETGNLNVIVWKSLGEEQRRELLGARLLGVTGEVQREGEVLHIIAHRLEDHSSLLGSLLTHSRDFH